MNSNQYDSKDYFIQKNEGVNNELNLRNIFRTKDISTLLDNFNIKFKLKIDDSLNSNRKPMVNSMTDTIAENFKTVLDPMKEAAEARFNERFKLDKINDKSTYIISPQGLHVYCALPKDSNDYQGLLNFRVAMISEHELSAIGGVLISGADFKATILENKDKLTEALTLDYRCQNFETVEDTSGLDAEGIFHASNDLGMAAHRIIKNVEQKLALAAYEPARPEDAPTLVEALVATGGSYETGVALNLRDIDEKKWGTTDPVPTKPKPTLAMNISDNFKIVNDIITQADEEVFNKQYEPHRIEDDTVYIVVTDADGARLEGQLGKNANHYEELRDYKLNQIKWNEPFNDVGLITGAAFKSYLNENKAEIIKTNALNSRLWNLERGAENVEGLDAEGMHHLITDMTIALCEAKEKIRENLKSYMYQPERPENSMSLIEKLKENGGARELAIAQRLEAQEAASLGHANNNSTQAYRP